MQRSVFFRLLFKASGFQPTEGTKWGDRGVLSITDLSGQPPDSRGLSFSTHTNTHAVSCAESQVKSGLLEESQSGH